METEDILVRCDICNKIIHRGEIPRLDPEINFVTCKDDIGGIMKFYSEEQINKILDKAESIESAKEILAEDDNAFEVDGLDVLEGEVIVVSFPQNNAELAISFTQLIQSMYPDNPTIALVNDVDVLIENPDEALEMLNGMKAKIEILKGTAAGKIII